MAEDYQIHFHLETQAAVFDTMLKTHQIFEHHGIKITGDSEFLLSEYQDEHEFDFEPINNWREALKKLAAWPDLGTLSYWLEDREISVAYSKEIGNASIQCITIFFTDRFFDDEEGRRDLPLLLDLVVDLHHRLKSIRTIWGWSLYAWFGYDELKELQRLSEKKVEGLYWLDILRRDYVSEARKRFLCNHLREKSILKQLFDGSLYYQQTDTPESWFRENEYKDLPNLPSRRNSDSLNSQICCEMESRTNQT
jgi:hypothetical protein